MARHCRPFFLSPTSTTPPPLPLLLFFYPRRRRSPAVPPPPPSAAAAMAASSPSSWACSRCTFLNPSSQKSACEMCLSSPPPPTSPSPRVLAGSSSSSSSSVAQWACKACTFFNSVELGSCEMCGAKGGGGGAAALGGGLVDEVEDGDGRLVGSVFFPLRRCKRRIEEAPESERSHEGKKAAVVSNSEDSFPESGLATVKILSYNVWFREDLELHARMKAIGDLIQHYNPDLICFQEVTPNIFDIFRQSKWWKVYKCTLTDELATTRPYFCMQLSRWPVKSFTCMPFDNSIMGRELCVADINITANNKLCLATSHLESPCPAPPTWDQMFSKERVAQAKEALKLLDGSPNVIFGGDMNWDDDKDGEYPLIDGWVDAWKELKPGEKGWTYDTRANTMLSGNRTLQKRLDRFLCKLRDFKVTAIEMIGMDAIAGLSYIKEKKVRNQVKKLELPVMPSDHYGLLLTITETVKRD